ncbi:hypothetical protein ENBRE01_1512 [Enteropsectra breve]|nr:hypothetical protein ENBRE01_1512 [Enteropsectra breve]
MDNQKNAEDAQRYLKLLSSASKTINDMSTNLILRLHDTDYKVLGNFKQYIVPKKNIEQLLAFYRSYIESNKVFEKIKIDIDKSGLGSMEQDKIKIKKLEKIGMLDKVLKLQDTVKVLDEYEGVNIVEALQKSIKETSTKLIGFIKAAFLNSLSKLPKIVKHAPQYAAFLLQNTNVKDFLGRYTFEAHKRLGFDKGKSNIDELVEQTENLTGFLNNITNTNIRILGARAAQNINVGLIKLILIDLNSAIGNALAKIQKENSATHIQMLIALHSNLRHTDGPVVKELESLFVFKKQINKLILDCFIQFFADLERLSRPCPNLGTEDPLQTMVEVLQAMDSHKEVKKEWVEEKGRSFGVHRHKDLGSNFGQKCIQKAKRLSVGLKNEQKAIYMLNNCCVFRGILQDIDGKEIKAVVDKYAQILTGMWRVNLEPAKNTAEFNSLILSELKKTKKYKLPEDTRKVVVSQIASIVENIVMAKGFHIQDKDTIVAIQNAYRQD